MLFAVELRSDCCFVALGRLWSPTWSLLGTSWSVLGGSWSVLGASWSVLGSSWSVLGASWSQLGRSWVSLGPNLATLGRLLDPTWRLLGALGPNWAALGFNLQLLGSLCQASLLSSRTHCLSAMHLLLRLCRQAHPGLLYSQPCTPVCAGLPGLSNGMRCSDTPVCCSPWPTL